MKKVIPVLYLILSSYFCLSNNMLSGSWWIATQKSGTAPNTWMAFRGKVNLDKQDISGIEALIAVDSKYWLWVNGQLVVFEGGLKRGPSPTDTYFDRVEMENFLHEGENTIAVLVWYFGKDGFCHKSSGTGSLLFQLGTGKKSPQVDWKAIQHPAFGISGKPWPNFRLPESNIHFDAQKDIENWTNPEYDDVNWKQAINLAKAGEQPWGKLWERPIPLWDNSGLVNYTDFETIQTDTSTIVKAFLPKNIAITPYFRINCDAGKLIDLRTDNYKGGGEYNVRTEYVTRKGEQEFETYGYMNGHYVIYTFPKGVNIMDLKYRETKYKTAVIGDFECNDQFYNALWQKSVNTLNVNMRDGIQDPDRERAQWWGDVVILMGEILYTLDEDGKKSIDKAISNLVEWQKPDSAIFSPVPAGNWDKELPCQMLASIGEYGFWNFYYYTGDKQLISYVYPHVKKYLSLWELKDNGLVKHRKGDWTWLDWGQQIDSSLIYNTWYYMALDAAMKMAEMESDVVFSKDCRNKMIALKTAFNQVLWTKKGYRSENYKDNYDDRGNGLAVVAGLADQDKWDTIAKVLGDNYNSSPYTEKYILEALFLMNRTDEALLRMKKRYKKMVESPITTLWEGWGIGSEGFGGGTYNHGWSGGPLTLLMQYVAGIVPDSPGWLSYAIEPKIGRLNEVDCIVPTPQGLIKTKIKKSVGTFSLDASVPEKIQGKLVLPMNEDSKKIYFDGQMIWQSGKIISLPKGIEDLSFENGKTILKVKGLKCFVVKIVA